MGKKMVRRCFGQPIAEKGRSGIGRYKKRYSQPEKTQALALRSKTQTKQPKMGISPTFVALLVGLVAWSSLGSATPVPTTPVPTTPSVESTTMEETQRTESPETHDEPSHTHEEPVEEPQESNDNPTEEGQVQISMQQEFSRYPRPPPPSDMMMVPRFPVPSNPDGQSDSTDIEMMDRQPEEQSEPEEEAVDPTMQQEEEQTMVRYPNQRREPEEQSEDDHEELIEPLREEEELGGPDFPKTWLAEERPFAYQHFPDDSPMYNEVEGMYANQQERLLPQDIALERIPVMQFRI